MSSFKTLLIIVSIISMKRQTAKSYLSITDFKQERFLLLKNHTKKTTYRSPYFSMSFDRSSRCDISDSSDTCKYANRNNIACNKRQQKKKKNVQCNNNSNELQTEWKSVIGMLYFFKIKWILSYNQSWLDLSWKSWMRK